MGGCAINRLESAPVPIRFLLALFAAGALLVAGCGDDKKDDAQKSERSVSGTGYTVERPAQWQDGTKQGRKQGVFNFDLVLVKPRKSFNTNVNILRAQAPGVDLDDLRRGYRGELDSIGATNVTDSEPISVDGDKGITYRYLKKTPNGDSVRGRQVLVVHAGYVHSITLTAIASEFATAQDEFDSILDSWRWS